MHRGLLLTFLLVGLPLFLFSARVKSRKKNKEDEVNSQDSGSETQTIQSGMVLHNRFRLERRIENFRGNTPYNFGMIPMTVMTASQSSDSSSAHAGKALTEHPDSTWPGTCTATAEETTPWWKVSLLYQWTITSVVLTNRKDCCEEGLQNIDVSVDNKLCASGVTVDLGRSLEVSCFGTGSEILVQRPGQGVLTICGFKAFGFQATGFTIPATSIATIFRPATPVVQPFKEKPKEKFPPGTVFHDQKIDKHVKAGQFGDVWEATDLEDGSTQVAVKIYYRWTPEGLAYLTWNTASDGDRDEMRKSVLECYVVRQIIEKGSAFYPAGSARICECRQEYIRQGEVNPDSVMYTVWEFCGNTDIKGLRNMMAGMDFIQRVHKARHLMKQLIEAVALLSIFNPPLIHHDLKSENVVISGNIGEAESYDGVKLIDFTCFVIADQSAKDMYSMGDGAYLPPEYSSDSNAFDDPPSSFDMYSAGIIYMELLCPPLQELDWKPSFDSVLNIEIVTRILQTRCSDVFQVMDNDSISNDLAIIEKLTVESAGERLSPEEALEAFGALEAKGMQTHLQKRASKSNLSVPQRIFSIGDEVEAFIGGAWQVAKVVAWQAGYSLQFQDGAAPVDVDPDLVRAHSARPSLDTNYEGLVAGLHVDVRDLDQVNDG